MARDEHTRRGIDVREAGLERLEALLEVGDLFFEVHPTYLGGNCAVARPYAEPNELRPMVTGLGGERDHGSEPRCDFFSRQGAPGRVEKAG